MSRVGEKKKEHHILLPFLFNGKQVEDFGWDFFRRSGNSGVLYGFGSKWKGTGIITCCLWRISITFADLKGKNVHIDFYGALDRQTTMKKTERERKNKNGRTLMWNSGFFYLKGKNTA